LSLYSNILYPLLRGLDAERAHDLGLAVLGWSQEIPPARALLRALAGNIPDRPVTVLGLRFPNILGVAAGFDKDVRATRALGLLGFGHVEVGTVTPRPQPGNPKPRVYRLTAERAIINRMGFPNEGAARAVARLRRLRRTAPRDLVIGVSLGKQKETPLEDAARDYIRVMNRAWPDSDYLAVNISSPNTPGLRELQGTAYLRSLCSAIVAQNRRLDRRLALGRRPLLVKVAPDMEPADLDAVLDVLLECGVDGIIATNTTLSREGVSGPVAAEAGGLSGAPLTARSTAFISRIRHKAGPRFPIIGVGGIFTPQDAIEKLDAGANLLQVYTSFVYGGPSFPGQLLRGIEALR
jgi:dihydroorotate dehydrogenase